MLIDELKLWGVPFRVDGDKLVVETSQPLTEYQRDFIKKNKPSLIREVLNTALTEIVDGDIFPLYRFKGKNMPTCLPWLHEMLEYRLNRVEIAAEYARIYKQTYNSGLKEKNKEGTARYVANIWLLNHRDE